MFCYVIRPLCNANLIQMDMHDLNLIFPESNDLPLDVHLMPRLTYDRDTGLRNFHGSVCCLHRKALNILRLYWCQGSPR